MQLASANNRIAIDPASGCICSLRAGDLELIKPSDLPGPFRMHVPIEEFFAHTLNGHRATPEVQASADRIICRYPHVVGKRGPIPIETEMEIRAVGDGSFELQLRVKNKSQYPVEQIFFPWIGGFRQIDGADDQVTWGRSEFFPWRAWGKAANRNYPKFMNYHGRPQVSKHCGQSYQTAMKWMDFSGSSAGVSLYSKDTSARVQYMYIDTPTFGAMLLDMAWYTYPFLKPGQSWRSNTYVLYPHSGDWRRGVMKFKQFADEAFKPVQSPAALDDTLGQYTFWISMHLQDWRDLKYRFSDIPAVAAEAKRAGFNQMTIVRATALDFCLPHVLREPLGTAQELKTAVDACREMGVNVIPFVTCRLIRPTTVPADQEREWYKEDIAGARYYSNWTYDPSMTPNMPIRQTPVRAAYIACAGSKNWQRAYFDNVDMMAREWGFHGLMFDVSFDWVGDLCFNPLHNHDNPDQDPECLAGAMRQSRQQLVKQFGADDVVFSGECQWDVATEFQDLTWDWATIADTGSAENHVVTEAFDMGFPRAKTCTKCTTERGPINRVFVSGRLIEMYLEEGTGRLGDYPELTAYLQTLLEFKRRFVDFLARRDAYLRDMCVTVAPTPDLIARVHRHREQALVMLANMTTTARAAQLKIDLAELLGPARFKLQVWSRELQLLATIEVAQSASLQFDIPAEDIAAVLIVPAQ